MGLLVAELGMPLTARQLVASCRLFGITENSTRVALARLSAVELVESAERGSYQLGEAATGLAGDVATWREAEGRLAQWNGRYVMVHCGPLGRSDRTALRHRERVLDMVGLREYQRDLYVRPDNLAGGVKAVRRRLHGLGLDREASVFAASQFDDANEHHLQDLWDGDALNQRYRQQHQQLSRWQEKTDQLAIEDAARECFLLGNRAIRYIVFDPLLPAPLIDEKARSDFFEQAKIFDRAGHAIWQQFYAGQS